jgi:DNA-binding CsgD family transcriptional regulator
MGKNSHLPFDGLRGKKINQNEITALRLYAADVTIPTIADRIGIKANSVRKALRRLRCKLGSYTLTNAYAKAKRLRLL